MKNKFNNSKKPMDPKIVICPPESSILGYLTITVTGFVSFTLFEKIETAYGDRLCPCGRVQTDYIVKSFIYFSYLTFQS